MKIIEFYRGSGRNNVGYTLKNMRGFSHDWMEVDHDYIQWLFPSNEPSMMNDEAPVMTKEESEIFKADPELQEKMKESLLQFLDFLGLRLVGDDLMSIQAKEPTERIKNPVWWMGEFNHNMLRITRCLKSLRLTGLDRYAAALFDFLQENKSKFSSNTFGHWTRAVTEPLWPNVLSS
jgi:hypothetical protein